MSIRPDKGYRCDLCRAIGGVQACRYEGDPAVDNSVGCANCKTNKVECSFLHEVGWRHQPKGKEVYIAPAEVLFRPLRRKRKAAALDGGGDGNGNGSGKEEERWFAFDGEDKAFLKPTQEEPSDTQLALMRLRSGAPPSSSSPKQTTTTARRPSKSPTASASSSTSKRPKPSSSTTNRVQATKMLPPPPPKQNRSCSRSSSTFGPENSRLARSRSGIWLKATTATTAIRISTDNNSGTRPSPTIVSNPCPTRVLVCVHGLAAQALGHARSIDPDRPRPTSARQPRSATDQLIYSINGATAGNDRGAGVGPPSPDAARQRADRVLRDGERGGCRFFAVCGESECRGFGAGGRGWSGGAGAGGGGARGVDVA
ncbi:unnamed protein product [Tilletia controversa]|nr:unnamed protein product [Tilletia controversa]